MKLVPPHQSLNELTTCLMPRHLGGTHKALPRNTPNTMNELHISQMPNENEEKCESCNKVDVLENMHVTEDQVLCDACNEQLTASVEAQAEDYEPDTI